MNLMQLPDELNSKRQDPEDEYKTKMYQSLSRVFTSDRKDILCEFKDLSL